MVKRIFLISLFLLMPLMNNVWAEAVSSGKTNESYEYGYDLDAKNIPLDINVMRRALDRVRDNGGDLHFSTGIFFQLLLNGKTPTPYSMRYLFETCDMAAKKSNMNIGAAGDFCADFVGKYLEDIQGAREYLPHYVIE